jgi:radical SAM superfamily enzyme
VLRGTDLAELYQNGAFRTLTMDEYVDVVVRALSILPDSISIHRLTGDPPRRLLIAPDWATDKKRVLNKIRERMVGRDQIVSDAVR